MFDILEDMIKFYMVGVGVTIVAAVGLGYGANALVHMNDEDSYIPDHSNVSEEFVDVNELEILVKDVDNNGSDELIVSYKGHEYLFIDDNDKPTLQEYQIIPSQIAPLVSGQGYN